MANTVKLKRSAIAGDAPSASDLEIGEVAINTADGLLYTKHTDNSINKITIADDELSALLSGYTAATDATGSDLIVFYDVDAGVWERSTIANAALQGEKGQKGQGGSDGDKGQKGEVGVQGNDGGNGAKGQKGEKGQKGQDGTAGGDGSNGDKGQKGEVGAKGQKGQEGNFGGATFDYTFSTNTADSDPTSGKLKFNNANLSSASQMYIDNQDGSATSIVTFLRTIDDSTSTIKGHFRISNRLNADDFALFTIGGSITEATGYVKVNCSYVSGSATSFSNDEDIIITFARTGDAGDAGAAGSDGSDGAKGQKGEKGQKGQTGAGGSNGTDGDKGQKGEVGATGSSGAAGAKGQKGEVGATGGDGSDGGTGQKGQKGEVGSAGANGSNGQKGQKGEVGATGAAGSTGADGSDGGTGQKGQKGEVGATGASGSDGAAGQKGQKGEVGATGSAGATGAAGSDGATGAKGQKGEVGATGANGTTGQKGQKGEVGAAGASGSNGAVGQKGQKGEVGVTGATGPTGSNGSDGGTGAKGQKGEVGATGSNGSAGQKGQKGEVGATGSAGGVGQKGQKGEVGAAGSNGSDGGVGQKGQKGEVGATGSAGGAGDKGQKGEGGLTTTDADTLDSLNSTQFLRSDAADIMTGVLNLQSNLDMRTDNSTSARYVHIPRGGGLTFYGDASTHHAITSRSASNSVADDILISSYGGVHIDLDSNSNNSSGANFTIGKHDGGTSYFTFNGETSDLTVSGNITAYSDKRLKDNIETLDGSKVYDMRGVSFTKEGKAGSGVIAQELKTVAPELVIEGDEYLSVAYGNLVGYLIETVKELNERIKKLEDDAQKD